MRAQANKQDSKREAQHPPGIAELARDVQPFHRREWLAQRVGWALLALILLAGLAGVFGRGPLAEQRIETAAVRLDYERFVRRGAPTRWELTLLSPSAGGTADIAIDAAFASNFEIHSIQPEPSSTSLSGGRWIYSFETRDDGETLVVFVVQPERIGRHEGAIHVGSSPPLMLSQLTYP
jgi:hypothetical protein